jgi:hypothetical protein
MNDFVKTILPWIGTAVAGPLGGMAVKFFADKLGVPAEKAEDLSNWLKGASPEDLLKAKQADQAFELEMKKLGFQEIYQMEELIVRDRMSARDREAKTGDQTTRQLAICYTVGYFVLLMFAFFVKFPEANTEILSALLGILSAAQIGIINYYFGSSKGSADKTDSLMAAVKAKMS